MSGVKLIVLCIVCPLSIVSSRAQNLAGSKPPNALQQQLTVRVGLPSTVGLIQDYAAILLSKEDDKLQKLTTRRRPRTSNPTVVFTVPLPRSWITKKLAKDE
ncbi:hypothetical protein SAMN00120144_3408 [Hymenobacter roseosalivarius DSM 11622]|uniref:Uncharacterized protein n=1 Tax=Hymenobacter roseosalivarius DSM 11622 TaxID=645990 RepID=A0A1W1UV96_9BACT|nr:hypothetical protein SAMN00120144_3408 [Hymenobacter roseosalivarius DSM 11622]